MTIEAVVGFGVFFVPAGPRGRPRYVFTVVMETTLSYAGLVCVLTLVLENDRIPPTEAAS